jgi:hypothetical protein
MQLQNLIIASMIFLSAGANALDNRTTYAISKTSATVVTTVATDATTEDAVYDFLSVKIKETGAAALFNHADVKVELIRADNHDLKIVSRYEIDAKFQDDSFTRNSILLEMARVMRAGNERLAVL